MNRLECIKSMVSKCNTAADIGTDHGYIAEMLLCDDTAKNVIATDLNSGPLKRAIEYLKSQKLSDRCIFRQGSGLCVLNENEAEAIIIAGMGGELIADILETSKNVSLTAKQLILQPMTGIDKLRYYLLNNGYKIIDENIVKEFQHYYFIIKAEVGCDEVKDEIYYEISKHLLEKKDALLYEYIQKIIKNNFKIIENLKKSQTSDFKDKIHNLVVKNEKLSEMIKNDFK